MRTSKHAYPAATPPAPVSIDAASAPSNESKSFTMPPVPAGPAGPCGPVAPVGPTEPCPSTRIWPDPRSVTFNASPKRTASRSPVDAKLGTGHEREGSVYRLQRDAGDGGGVVPVAGCLERGHLAARLALKMPTLDQ